VLWDAASLVYHMLSLMGRESGGQTNAGKGSSDQEVTAKCRFEQGVKRYPGD